MTNTTSGPVPLSAGPPLDAMSAENMSGRIFGGPGDYLATIQGVPALGGIRVYACVDTIFGSGAGVRGPAGISVKADGRVRVVGWLEILRIDRPAGPDPVFDQGVPVPFTIPPYAVGLPLPRPVASNPRLRYAPRLLWAIVTQTQAPGAVVSVSQASSN
jgi:hypothetical protein